MLVLTTIAETRAACGRFRAAGKTLGLVPTMGALHQGHLSLVQAAQSACDVVAVSIFVNPTQFSPNEDFAAYPRTFDEDYRILQAAGVALLFAPTAEEMYPPGATTFVEVEGLSHRLDGLSRPGHFRGGGDGRRQVAEPIRSRPRLLRSEGRSAGRRTAQDGA